MFIESLKLTVAYTKKNKMLAMIPVGRKEVEVYRWPEKVRDDISEKVRERAAGGREGKECGGL
jgi:hypothetical protein